MEQLSLLSHSLAEYALESRNHNCWHAAATKTQVLQSLFMNRSKRAATPEAMHCNQSLGPAVHS